MRTPQCPLTHVITIIYFTTDMKLKMANSIQIIMLCIHIYLNIYIAISSENHAAYSEYTGCMYGPQPPTLGLISKAKEYLIS